MVPWVSVAKVLAMALSNGLGDTLQTTVLMNPYDVEVCSMHCSKQPLRIYAVMTWFCMLVTGLHTYLSWALRFIVSHSCPSDSTVSCLKNLQILLIFLMQVTHSLHVFNISSLMFRLFLPYLEKVFIIPLVWRFIFIENIINIVIKWRNNGVNIYKSWLFIDIPNLLF